MGEIVAHTLNLFFSYIHLPILGLRLRVRVRGCAITQGPASTDLICGDLIITFEYKYDLKKNDKLKFNVHIALFKGLEERIQLFICW
jgi:hypothetical protein